MMDSGTKNSQKELLGNMQKFLSQVSHALQQLNGDVTLAVGSSFVCMGEKHCRELLSVQKIQVRPFPVIKPPNH